MAMAGSDFPGCPLGVLGLQWRDRARLSLASRNTIHHSYQSAFYAVNDWLDRYGSFLGAKAPEHVQGELAF